jgi:hypothetical protein
MRAILSALGAFAAGFTALFAWLRDRRLKKEGRRDLELENTREALRREKLRDDVERDVGGLSPDELADRLRDPERGWPRS